MRTSPKILLGSALVLLLLVSGCGSSSGGSNGESETASVSDDASGSYGNACPILLSSSTRMAIVISSVPTAADYDTRRTNLDRALITASASSIQELKMEFNSDLNSILGSAESFNLTGGKLKVVEELRAKVWDWDWKTVSESDEVLDMMELFADIDQSCGN